MQTCKQRQSNFRNKMKEQGNVQVTGYVSEQQAAEIKEVMRRLKDDHDLEVGLLRDTRTGRYEKV